jgi:hypothetical protein
MYKQPTAMFKQKASDLDVFVLEVLQNVILTGNYVPKLANGFEY